MKKLRKTEKIERTVGVSLFILGLIPLFLTLMRYFLGSISITGGGVILRGALLAFVGTIFVGILMCGAGVYCFFVKRGHVHVFAIFLVLIIVWFPLDFAASNLRKANQYRQDNLIYHHSFVPNSTGYAISPDYSTYYKINSLGLRNPEIGNKTKTRMLMLGDSFTEGYGVNYSESMPARLQYYLGDDYEVINGGVASYSPTLEYLYLTTSGIKLHPDIVILGLDNSDLRDDYISYAPKSNFDKNGNLVSVTALRFPRFYYTSQIVDVFIALITDKTLCPRCLGLGIKDVGNPRFDNHFHSRLEKCEDFEAQWNLSYKYIKAIKDYSDKNNITFYVALYPYGYQVATNQWTGGRKYDYFDSDKVYPMQLADCFNKYGGDIKVFNTLEDFKNKSSEKLYYDLDAHMTAVGYDVFAFSVYKQLISQNFSKKESYDGGSGVIVE